MRANAVTLAVALALALSSVAHADIEGDKATAAALADTALQRYERGEISAALELFSRASALVHAPTFALYEARCLAKLGRLTEAEDAYSRVERFDDAPTTTLAQRSAVADARQEHAALRRRREAEARPAASAAPVPVPAPPPSGPAAAAPAPGTHASPAPGTSAAVALGVGGLGVAVGITWGLVMMSRKSALDDGCPDGRCPASRSDDVDAFRSARTISAVGWTVGLLGLGVGAGLWIGRATSAPSVAGDVQLLVTPTGAGVAAHF